MPAAAREVHGAGRRGRPEGDQEGVPRRSGTGHPTCGARSRHEGRVHARCDHPGGATLMNRATPAYEVLGDEDKRILYDTGGLESVKELASRRTSRGAAAAWCPFSMLFGGGVGRRAAAASAGPTRAWSWPCPSRTCPAGQRRGRGDHAARRVAAARARRAERRRCAGRGRRERRAHGPARDAAGHDRAAAGEEVHFEEKCKSEADPQGVRRAGRWARARSSHPAHVRAARRARSRATCA